MYRDQYDQLVARAIVQHEVACIRSGKGAVHKDGPLPTLTVQRIMDAYGLEWSAYTDRKARGRAEQLIRNCLNEAWHDGLLAKKAREDGSPMRQGVWVLYYHPRDVHWKYRVVDKENA